MNPGDPDGVLVDIAPAAASSPPRIIPSQWSGWPADWWPPFWNNGNLTSLTDTAWTCVDLNASVLASMPPYLVAAAPTLDAEWLRNPDPDIYSSWDEFCKQLFWDFQLGEAFVLCTARYSSGWPARFHVVPPWAVNVEMEAGRRVYSIGQVDVTADMCHLRYQSTVDDAHGHGPLEAGAGRLVAAELLGRYATGLASAGGIPSSVITFPHELDPTQAEELKAQWVLARQSSLGEPAVLSGGVTWEATQLNPTDMALTELQAFTDARIAVMLGVPPPLVGLPIGDSLTYNTVLLALEQHWRAGLRPKASTVMAGLSGFLLPRQTTVELNRDEYVKPGPLERAQTAEIYNRIRDDNGQPVLSVGDIRKAERFRVADPVEGVLA